jgi:hypothetical protein
MRRTCPGPMIVPFQWVIMISSPSSRPYEHEPSPMPFSPFSSSSSRRKLRGTVEPVIFQSESMKDEIAVKTRTLGHGGRVQGGDQCGTAGRCNAWAAALSRVAGRRSSPFSSCFHHLSSCLVAYSEHLARPYNDMFRSTQVNPYDDIVGAPSPLCPRMAFLTGGPCGQLRQRTRILRVRTGSLS